MTSDQLRKIPGVDTLLNHPKLQITKSEAGINLLTYAIRQVLTQIRDLVKKGKKTPDENAIVSQIISLVK